VNVLLQRRANEMAEQGLAPGSVSLDDLRRDLSGQG
jgi:hypothetical protein